MNDFKANADALSADLLDRYFTGTCTPAEGAEVHTWAARRKNGEAGLEALRQLRATEPSLSWDVSTRWEAIAPLLDNPVALEDEFQKQIPTQVDGTPRESNLRAWLQRPLALRVGSILAACCLIAGVSLLSWYSGARRTNNVLSQTASTYTTARGKQATVTLPDGSTVLLNVSSQLEVPADYATGNRTLKLTGEALFSVKHKSAHAFTVVAGPSITRVLGTVFSVRHYSTDTVATVAVREGRVAVDTNILTAQQQIAVGRDGKGRIQSLDPARFSFAGELLILDSIPLSDAIVDLSRWYDADIVLGDRALGMRRIVGGFSAGSLTDLAVILERTFSLRVIRNGRSLTLYPKQ